MNAVTIEQLVAEAQAAAGGGRWQEAERLWQEVQRRQPGHPQALFSLGVHALQRGETGKALGLLKQARERAPQDPIVALTHAAALRQQGDPAGEREAIEAALAADAYFLPAMLAKSEWLERQGRQAAAAAMFANCLKVAPPEADWPAILRPRLEHAKEVSGRHTERFHAHLAGQLGTLQQALPEDLQGRWREALSIKAGLSKPYHSDSNQLHVPRLPAIPFYDRGEFPWAAQFEAQTDRIREELLAALERSRDRFSPYIAYKPGEPVNQWRELNHSDRWSTFHLWRGGEPVAENLEQCPATAAALQVVQMASISGLCPNAMFSALAPKTRIPPHHGETNARLVAHLPLVVPPGCRFRVGFERREWRVGELMVFDDTLEHEAANEGDELRVVLIFDVWNPRLSPAERELVNAIAVADREFNR